MEISELAFRLLLLFFPGIVCFYLVDALTVHEERKPHDVFLRAFIYGILSYTIYAGVLVALNSQWIETRTGFDFPDQISILRTITDSKVTINVEEIALVTFFAGVLAAAICYATTHRWLYRTANWWDISRKFGDANVWARTFNSDKTKWATVRDAQENKMYMGLIESFSDVEEVAELLLGQVTIYNEKTGVKLYEADHIYLARPKDCLTVEIPNPPTAAQQEGAVQDVIASNGQAKAPEVPKKPWYKKNKKVKNGPR